MDETLAEARKAAEGGGTAGAGFFFRDGVLHRRWVPRGRDEAEMVVEQLVLPKRCRPTVLKLAHDIPLAGHMGKNKTAQRVLGNIDKYIYFTNIRMIPKTSGETLNK